MTVPTVAWENAPIIVLFTVAFIFLIRYLTGWFTKQQAETREHQERQQQEWQKFIERRDLEWRAWMESYNKSNSGAMEKVAHTLDEIIKLIFEHDSKVHERVTAAARRRKPETGPLENDK